MMSLTLHKIVFAFTILLICLGFRWQLVTAECNVCQSNSAACINSTSFYLCFGGSKPNTDQMFTCKDGLVCTDLPNICFQSNTRPASCGDTSSCDLCNANNVFACTSRTTFAFCFGATQPSDVLGNCPAGTVCDASSQDICVYEVHGNSIICDLNAPAGA